LKNRPAQESLRGTALEFWVVGPFEGDWKASHVLEAKPDPTATYASSKPDEKLAWRPLQAEPSGQLNLRTLFNRNGVSADALTYVYSPKSQKVHMREGGGDVVRIWLNSSRIHEHASPRPARPDEDRVEVALQEGWNTLLAKVASIDKHQGLYLRFTGGEGLRIALKPEGK